MPITPASIVFLRTTDEPCFVISVTPAPADSEILPGLSGDIATVRRPVATQEGTVHVKNTFFVEELETLEARKARAESEAAEFRKRMRAEAESEAKPFLPN